MKCLAQGDGVDGGPEGQPPKPDQDGLAALQAFLAEQGHSGLEVDQAISTMTPIVWDGVCVLGYTQRAAIAYHEMALKTAELVARSLKQGSKRPGLGDQYVAALMARSRGSEPPTQPTHVQATAQECLRQRGFLKAAREGVDSYRQATGVPVIWDEEPREARIDSSNDG